APEPIDEFAVRDPDPDKLAAFLDKMEFRSLARRVGDGKAPERDGAAFPAKPMRAPVAQPRYAAQPAATPEQAQTFDTDAYECVTTLAQLEAWIAEARAAGVIGFDTETDSLSSSHAELCGVSIATGPNRACYVPLSHDHPEQGGDGGGGLDFAGDGRARPAQIDQMQALAELKPLLEDRAVLKVTQNGNYDLAVMSRHGVQVSPIEDTMLISYVISGGIHSHGMDELARRHLGHTPISFKSVTGTGKAQKSFRHVEL